MSKNENVGGERATRAQAKVQPDATPLKADTSAADRLKAQEAIYEAQLDAAWERAYPSIRRAGGATPDGKRPKDWRP